MHTTTTHTHNAIPDTAGTSQGVYRHPAYYLGRPARRNVDAFNGARDKRNQQPLFE